MLLNLLLSCPACNGDNLHQTRVEVFTRTGEDAVQGLHVTVPHDVAQPVTLDADIDANPSERRQGITIHFTCETCRCLPVLHIAQNKGSTYILAEA